MDAANELNTISHFNSNNFFQQQRAACIVTKIKQVPLHSSGSRRCNPCELTHMNMTVKSATWLLRGANQFAIFLDETTALSAVYTLGKKAQLMHCLRANKSLAEMQIKQTMKALQHGNNGEQMRWGFLEMTNQCGVQTEFSPPYSNRFNKSSKRLIQELRNMMQTMLLDTEVRAELSEKAISQSNYFRNRFLPLTINMDFLFRKWYNEAPNLSSLLEIGTKGYVF